MNTDDPKFTAHILGELDDLTSAERAEIGALIRADAAAAAEAAETQALAALLRRELQGEEAQPLTPAQRAAVVAATARCARMESAKVVPFSRRLTVLSAIAACLIVGVSIALIFQVMETDRTAGRHPVASSGAQPGPTIMLDATPEPPAEPLPAEPQLAAVARPEADADSLKFTDGKDLLAQVPQAAELRMPAPKITPPPAPPAPTAAPQPMADGERKITAGAQLADAPARLAGAAGGHALKPSPPLPPKAPAAGLAGKAEAAKSSNQDQLASFNPERSDALRDYRQRHEEIPGKPAASLPATISESGFLAVRENPLSTFGIDVDTASYAIVRRFLDERQLPPKSAVRIEELLNHFTYDYPQPKGAAPFSATMEAGACPWTPAHRLVRIGLKGREIARDKLAIIAKDVKIQVEFNPAQVSAYRLLGYETRRLAGEDFREDEKAASGIVAGHSATALYEIVPTGKDASKAAVLKYQTPAAQNAATSKELLTLKLHFKAPDGDKSKLLEFPLTDAGITWEKSSRDFRFAAAVAGYGMLLRDSPHKGAATWSSVRDLAVEGKGSDATGYRAEFISLIEKARALQR